jgi:arylsulfatase A-like enzyme
VPLLEVAMKVFFEPARVVAGALRRVPTWALVVWLGLSACADRVKPTRVVLITLDTLRADRFTEATMPLVWARAKRGVVFEQFYASTSSTQPTHATIFTGREPWQHGVTLNGAVLDDASETLAERFKSEGFATAAIVASFPLERRFGFAQGFDSYFDTFDHQQGTAKSNPHWAGVEVEDDFYSLADSITTRAVAAIDAASAPRQFYWFHYFDPHAPYGDAGGDEGGDAIKLEDLTAAARNRSPDFEALLERARAAYDVDARQLDRALERLFARLDADRDRFETHVFITADHGESFGEEGALGHGKRVIRSQVHVPGIVLSPRVSPAVRQDAAGSIDVMPTLLALAGIGGGDRWLGRNLIEARASEQKPTLGMRRTFPKPFKDVHTDGTVVTVHGPQFFLVRDGRLYIGDKEHVAGEDPAPSAELIERVRAIFAACEVELSASAGREDLRPETQRALEALGYTR